MKRKIKVIVTFSGGKDSLASLLWAIAKYGKENIIVVFCDTKWEHPLTYKYIIDIMDQLGMEIIILSSVKYDGFMDMVRKKKRFPSTKSRFCTEHLKSIPMIDWVLDQHKSHMIVVQGIRADESTARSEMNKQCRYFKYYFEPYDSNEIKIAKFEKKIADGGKLTIMQKEKYEKAQSRLAEGHNDEKYHTYRKKEVFEFCEKYADDIWRPVFDKTGNEVLQIILDAGLKPNPLYYMGFGRVGCFPCINVTHAELWMIIEKEYWIIDKLIEYEAETGQSFFPPKYIPKKYCSMETTNKDGKLVKYPNINDVVRYIKMKNAQGDLFEDENADRSCMSYYGICE